MRGTWRVDLPVRSRVVTDDDDRLIVAENLLSDEANLIAAAPEMLSILECLLEFWDRGTPIHASALIVGDVRDTVAKAKGES